MPGAPKSQNAQVRRAEAGARERHAFILRGRPTRAFASLAVFAASLFLGSGLYLIATALRNPMEASAGSLLAGACAAALGLILLGHLWPGRPRYLRGNEARSQRT